VGIAVLSLVALAGCATPDTSAPATAVSADAQQQAAPALKPKNCLVGSRLCTHEPQVDPSVTDMSGQALGDAQRGHQVGG
jgi:hypothetical protein